MRVWWLTSFAIGRVVLGSDPANLNLRNVHRQQVIVPSSSASPLSVEHESWV